MSRSGPPVLTPPPFIFLGALATGMALQAVWPLRLLPHSLTARLLGGCLVLGGLGLPVPEEAPIILAAVLSHKKAMFWPFALAACFTGVLVGDFVVYFLGYFYGERVLGFRLTRKFLTRAREAQIKGYFHRHGLKILVVGRFAVGFRTAAYLTAGILRHPPLRLLVTDLFAGLR